MKIVTSMAMKGIDLETERRFGVPTLVLMENAGATVADVAISEFGTQGPVIICGKGGNGGDGFVAARHLAMQGVPSKVFILAPVEELSGDAGVNFGVLAKGFSGIVELHAGTTEDNLGMLSRMLQRTDLVIDCMLGTGFASEPTGAIAQAIELVNSVKAPVLACDIPSGVDGSTGKVPGEAVFADVTCTFGLPKIGHLLYPGASHTGKLVLSNVGFPQVMLEDPEIPSNVLTKQEAAGLIPKRVQHGHKGTFGRVLVIGGSISYPGAPILSGLASLKTGAGLTFVLVPDCIYASVAARFPELITQSAPSNTDGAFAQSSVPHVMRLAADASCVLIGPGLSRSADLQYLVGEVMGKLEVPVIIDADALSVLARLPQSLLLRAERGWPTVLTPHWGEAGRFGTTATDIATDPIAVARRFAMRYGSITLLKSARTIIASPKGQYYINVTGNSSLSKGGSGDVLSGHVAALIAQGLPPFEAGVLGSYIFGLAAEESSKLTGEYGTTSTQVADMIPLVMKELTADENAD